MPHDSPDDLLVLHAVRLSGFADDAALARRFDLDLPTTETFLRDAEALGWTTSSDFAGTAGWSLTDRGRAENERQLAAELATIEGEPVVRTVHRQFLPLNAQLLQACTDWQLGRGPGGRLVPNDHTDRGWDLRVLDRLAAVGASLPRLVDRLAGLLSRFGGYDVRFAAALERADVGDLAFVDGTHLDSCHRVWFELHEDLIATLGIERGAPD